MENQDSYILQTSTTLNNNVNATTTRYMNLPNVKGGQTTLILSLLYTLKHILGALMCNCTVKPTKTNVWHREPFTYLEFNWR